jgi:hypothetical protein
MRVAIHVTHEALFKIGGIGEVLNGLTTSPSYQSFFDKTLFYGPLFEPLPFPSPTIALGKDGIVLYESRHKYDAGSFGKLFSSICEKYGINLVYGKRKISHPFLPQRSTTVDVLLVDITHMPVDLVNSHKYLLWEKYGLTSDRYDHDWDYEQYLRVGIPYAEISQALYPQAKTFYHFAHEYMGIPSLLFLKISSLYSQERHKLIFYAHEVAPVRRIVERLPGHDLTFYPILEEALSQGNSLEDIFGSQMDWGRTALVKLAKHFDAIFAVGDLVAKEYKFLCPEVEEEKVKVVYNAIPVDHGLTEETFKTKEKILQCLSRKVCERVDLLFTHVCRLVKSKGIWRDFILLTYLDPLLEKSGLKGVYILLATELPQGRPPEVIAKMVEEYGWPFVHRIGYPDLVGYEVEIYERLSKFNEKSRSLKGIFINQFGFSKRKCGKDFPEDIDTIDLRLASDAEFGMSIYEPFGIAHIETLPGGGFPVLSTSCGVYYFLKKHFPEEQTFFPVDFIGFAMDLPSEFLLSLKDDQREVLEHTILAKIAKRVFELIPKTKEEKLSHYQRIEPILRKLDWDSVVKEYFLKALP